MLCNKEIENSDLHVLTNEEHQLYLEAAVTCDTEDKTLQYNASNITNEVVNDTIVDLKLECDLSLVGPELICDICDITLPFCSIDQLTKDKKRHRLNKKIKNLEVHYMTDVISESELKCKICLCTLERNANIVENHLNCDDHEYNYLKLLLDNNIIITKKLKLYCKICNIVISKMYELAHINNYGHKKNLKTNENQIYNICK